jgi:chaperonin cofactor prefoldin
MNSDELQEPQAEEPLGMQAASLQALQAEETQPAVVADPDATIAEIEAQAQVTEQPKAAGEPLSMSAVPDPWADDADTPEPSIAVIATPEPLSEDDQKLLSAPEVPEPEAVEMAVIVEATPIVERPIGTDAVQELEQRIAALQEQEAIVKQEIANLQTFHAQLRDQVFHTQAAIGRMVQDGLMELEQRRQSLQISVEQLERRQERIRKEMRTTFAGVSQDIAIRVQSFKDYLVGSLQDLALSAEQLNLAPPVREPEKSIAAAEPASPQSSLPKFSDQGFQEQTKRIRSLLDQYRNRPDYYGPPWQLRRTFEPIHADRVSNWFFSQGGRGAIRTMGSRLQNILIASATVSILRSLYDERLRTLILAQSPERLGEWRRGLQDCLGITRSDFGPDRGMGLFEDPYVVSQKADRVMKDGQLPFIIIDETEEQIDLTLLQYPLWLAFAPNPQASSSYNY